MERTIKPRPLIHPNIECAGVLVVEDNAIQRANMVCQLRELGVHKIYEAENGLVGLNIVRNLYQPPAIIVLDLHMPGMDGIELAQHMVPEGVRPYLLLASAVEMSILGSVEVMLEALDLPLLGILRKPFHLEHLQAAIVRYSTMNLAHRERLREPPGVATTATSLQCALDKGYIQPFYQPKVKLASGLVTGLEALARWVEPDGLAIAPESFIDVAESYGLINALTLRLLDTVLQDLVHWHENGFYPTIALNISAYSLSDRNFPNEIIRRVERARISPSAVVLEITESALVRDVAVAIGTLGRLRLKGFGLSIDDYGTGFSSMQQLSRLPFTELKIDRTFVSGANKKHNLRVMLESAIGMGLKLGLNTAAEGVEMPQEYRLLKSLGCQYAQGFLIAKPMPAGDLLGWLDEEQQRINELCLI